MLLGDKLVGVLDFQSERLDWFSADDTRIMTALAEQITVAEQLRSVDLLKSRFLASMSHELRTPLHAILNFTELVSMGMLGPVNEKQVDALNKSLDSGKHLMNEEVEQLQANGFDGAIGKPMSVKTFPDLLERIIQGEGVWHVS